MLDLYAEFEKALDTLEQHQINYALCGGLVVTFLAQPRFTEDIDILVSPEGCERCKENSKRLKDQFDIDALRAGIRKNWAEGRYAAIVEIADKLPAVALQQDHVLAALIGAGAATARGPMNLLLANFSNCAENIDACPKIEE